MGAAAGGHRGARRGVAAPPRPCGPGAPHGEGGGGGGRGIRGGGGGGLRGPVRRCAATHKPKPSRASITPSPFVLPLLPLPSPGAAPSFCPSPHPSLFPLFSLPISFPSHSCSAAPSHRSLPLHLPIALPLPLASSPSRLLSLSPPLPLASSPSRRLSLSPSLAVAVAFSLAPFPSTLSPPLSRLGPFRLPLPRPLPRPHLIPFSRLPRSLSLPLPDYSSTSPSPSCSPSLSPLLVTHSRTLTKVEPPTSEAPSGPCKTCHPCSASGTPSSGTGPAALRRSLRHASPRLKLSEGAQLVLGRVPQHLRHLVPQHVI